MEAEMTAKNKKETENGSGQQTGQRRTVRPPDLSGLQQK
jgi:hypothetical protein